MTEANAIIFRPRGKHLLGNTLLPFQSHRLSTLCPFFCSLLHQIQADSSRLCRPISCLLLCLSSLNFPSGLSCWQFCCTALSVPAVSFFHVTLHRASWSSKTKVVSLPSKFFLETCFFQTPNRYLSVCFPFLVLYVCKQNTMLLKNERIFVLFSLALALCSVSF